jgi:hypothetical protein
LTAQRAVFVVEKRVDSPKYYINPAAWVLPGKINPLKNCAHCHWGLTTLSGEVNARIVMLLSLFDLTQGRIRGGKAGQQS